MKLRFLSLLVVCAFFNDFAWRATDDEGHATPGRLWSVVKCGLPTSSINRGLLWFTNELHVSCFLLINTSGTHCQLWAATANWPGSVGPAPVNHLAADRPSSGPASPRPMTHEVRSCWLSLPKSFQFIKSAVFFVGLSGYATEVVCQARYGLV